jgi:hypothetical protein
VFENDYIMRMILQLVRVLRRSLTRQYPSFKDEISDIEGSVAEAVDMDPRLMFSLAPESLVSVLQLGNFDAKLGGYVVRSIFYEADLLDKDGQTEKAKLRREQAEAINAAFCENITAADLTPAALEEYLDENSPEEAELSGRSRGSGD